MPVAMFMRWEGVSKSLYEQLRKSVNWEGNVPKGAMFHVAAFSNKGAHITDVWETAGDFNNFVEKRIMPAVKKAGVKTQPDVEIYPAHAIFAPAYEPK